MKGYTLITGASHGIGKEMALQCARHGMNLILVALPEPQLAATAAEIKEQFTVQVDYLGIDLCQLDAGEKVYNWTQEKGYEVHNLINNAGLGDMGYFEDVSFSKTMKMVLLNNMATVSLTHYFLPQMKKRGFGHILGTSSIEGILIMPYKATYSATKRFLYSFYLALRQECKAFGVNVSVLCPGPVPTTAGAQLRIQMHGRKSALITRSVEEVGQMAIDGMLQRKGIIIPGRFLRTVVLTTWLVPFRAKMWILERFSRRYAKESKPVKQERFAL